MNKETNFFEAVIAFTMAIILSLFTTAYKVFVMLKFIEWFNLPISLSFKQWFGVLGIILLITHGMLTKAEKNEKSIWYNCFNPILESVFFISFFLFIYYILKFFI